MYTPENLRMFSEKKNYINVSDIQSMSLVCFSSSVAVVLFLVSKDDWRCSLVSVVRCHEAAGWTRLRPQFSDVKLFNGGELAKVQGKS